MHRRFDKWRHLAGSKYHLGLGNWEEGDIERGRQGDEGRVSRSRMMGEENGLLFQPSGTGLLAAFRARGAPAAVNL